MAVARVLVIENCWLLLRSSIMHSIITVVQRMQFFKMISYFWQNRIQSNRYTFGASVSHAVAITCKNVEIRRYLYAISTMTILLKNVSNLTKNSLGGKSLQSFHRFTENWIMPLMINITKMVQRSFVFKQLLLTENYRLQVHNRANSCWYTVSTN